MKTKKEVIIQKLLEIFKTPKELDLFMSTPNKNFHNKAPADCLEGGDYHIFDDLLNRLF